MTKIEEVARAVAAKLEARGIILVGTDWIGEIGTAAIEAMREPSEEMLEAAGADKTGWCGDTFHVGIAYEAMIDAALSDHPADAT